MEVQTVEDHGRRHTEGKLVLLTNISFQSFCKVFASLQTNAVYVVRVSMLTAVIIVSEIFASIINLPDN